MLRILWIFLTYRRGGLACGTQIRTPDQIDDWRRDLRTKITWVLVIKLLGLILLWWLFFRGRGP
jgi:hypothetical protein